MLVYMGTQVLMYSGIKVYMYQCWTENGLSIWEEKREKGEKKSCPVGSEKKENFPLSGK